MRMGHDVSAIVGKIHASKMAHDIHNPSDGIYVHICHGCKIILPFHARCRSCR
jgi:hypothetical protein